MGTDYFLYDAVSRVTFSRTGDPSVAGTPQRYQSFDYDLYGNRTRIGNRTGGGSWTYRTYTTSTSSNRLTGWSFDAAGNQLTGPGTSGAFSFTYDLANQMKTLAGVGADERYVYTADDERLYTEDQNTGERLWTLRDLGGLVLTEYRQDDDAWDWERDYIHRAGQLFASQGRGEGYLTHYHLDHLGTPRLVTRGGGGGTGGAAVLGIYAYHPFGEEASQAQQEDIRLRFTGHERDGRGAGFTDDLDYMHARYYSPGVGRFLSVDPAALREAVDRPQKWNRYAYVLGNPLRFIDPDGLTERTGWKAGTVENHSSQTIYIASDLGDSTDSKVVIPLYPGEKSTDFLTDADAIVIGEMQSIDGETEGAIKIASGDVTVEDGSRDGELQIGGDLEFKVLSAVGRAGNVGTEEARQQGWVQPESKEKATNDRRKAFYLLHPSQGRESEPEGQESEEE